MTVNNTSASITYAGDGISVNFAVPFRFLDATHLAVAITSAAGIETQQIYGTNFSAYGVDDNSGGGIVMLAAPLSGTRLAITRNIPVDQLTDYVPNDPFPAESHERALDKLTMIAQQLTAGLQGTLRVSPAEAAIGVPAPLPSKMVRANKVLSFDSNGDPVTFLNALTLATLIAAATPLPLPAATHVQFNATMTGFAKAGLADGIAVTTLARDVAGDGGGGTFRWDAASVVAPDGGTVFAADAGGAGRWVRVTIEAWLNGRWFGMRGLGAAGDDTAAFNLATAAASARRGGTVFLSAGPNAAFRFTSSVTLPDFVGVEGAAYNRNPANGAELGLMSTILIDHDANPVDSLGFVGCGIFVGFSCAIRGVAFAYPNQAAKTAAAPVPYPFTISTKAGNPISDSLTIEKCVFLNSYNTMRINNVGDLRIDNILGNPLNVGLQVDICFNVGTISNVSFWPYYTAGGALQAWVQANGTAFRLFRIDGGTFTAPFAYGYNVGYLFGTGFWGDVFAPTTDFCNSPMIVDGAAKLRVFGGEMIGTTRGGPAVWCRSATIAQFSGMRLDSTCGVGFQIDDLGTGAYQIDNVRGDNLHFFAVSTALSHKVDIGNCTWKFPPIGGPNVRINGEPLPAADLALALPAPLAAPTAIAGGYKFDLATLGDKTLSYDITAISQRNGLNSLEFDFVESGAAASTWYFQIFVATDTGTFNQVNYAALAPLILSGGAKRVRVPFHLNNGRFRQVLTILVRPTIAVAGAEVDITNIALSEQANTKTTDGQISNMRRFGYNEDAYGMGQTLFVRGKNRIVHCFPEAGIGRPNAIPTYGSYVVGDEMVNVSAAVTGDVIRYKCKTAGPTAPANWYALETMP